MHASLSRLEYADECPARKPDPCKKRSLAAMFWCSGCRRPANCGISRSCLSDELPRWLHSTCNRVRTARVADLHLNLACELALHDCENQPMLLDRELLLSEYHRF